MKATRIVFLWHMHQPCYRDPVEGSIVLPWARLHALKDYLGMVRLLEETPRVHATFNLVPSLLDQIQAYVEGDARELQQDVSMRPAEELDEQERAFALKTLFLASRNLIEGLPRFAELKAKRGSRTDEASLRRAAAAFSTQELRDLQVVSKLAWFDRSWQAADPVVSRLLAKGKDFTEEDKLALADREAALLADVIPAYRRAAEAGQIELATSPYYHPILPLLCDTEAHREAHPDAPLPPRFRHPEDAADQIGRALERHAALFGRAPAGMWPPEGSVSEAAVLEMAKAGIRWTASDEAVLERSLGRRLYRDGHGTAHPLEILYTPWVRKTEAGPVRMLFRDRALSDLIGFVYSSRDPRQAAADLVERFRRVGEAWRRQRLPGDPVISVILDGENAWEHYPDGGRVFLKALYEDIEADPRLEAVTASEALAAAGAKPLDRVFAGSWIHAEFSVWIGHADDRRAWELLGEAREAIARSEGRVAQGALERAREAFRVACGSDWYWWYGDDRSSENDLEFDRLFRRQLETVYRALELPVPEAVRQTLITARRIEVVHGQPTGPIRPVLDGEIAAGEWAAAGVYRAPPAGAMRRGEPGVRAVRFGVGGPRLHLLVETSGRASDLLFDAEVAVTFHDPAGLRYRVSATGGQVAIWREESDGAGFRALASEARAAAAEVLEVGIPLSELAPQAGRPLEFQVVVLQGGAEQERHPDAVPIRLNLEEVPHE